MKPWRKLLLDAVAPFESGVDGLRINGDHPDRQSRRPSRTAAVLVPILDLDEPEVVLTRRAEHLPHHPGQVSFPGGAAESDDVSAVQTALREANEEIGLPIDAALPIGFLDRMDTISDYRVLPVVAFVRPPVRWLLNEREVSEVFTVPASVAFYRSHYEPDTFQRDGRSYRVWTLHWQGYKIWGVTAAMLMNLVYRLEKAREQQDPAFRNTA
jgi:8-oxo-dGTP pyrophosphatase MutT (NUDIX family)